MHKFCVYVLLTVVQVQPGKYRVLARATVRANFDLASNKSGVLEPGEVRYILARVLLYLHMAQAMGCR